MIRRQRRNVIQTLDRLARSRWVRRAAIAWLALGAVYFLWEAETYRGITQVVAEWEYDQFGQQLPILTLLALFLLFAIPAFWLLSVGRRAHRRVALPRDTSPLGLVDAAVSAEVSLYGFLRSCAAVAFVAGLLVLAWTLVLPRASGPIARVDVASTAAETPVEGHSTLSGQVLYRRTATFEQDVMFLRRGIRFAPMIARDDSTLPVRYFVEVSNDRLAQLDARSQAVAYTGILRKNALPGPIVRLFRYAGFKVDRPYYVLYASHLSMCWRYYVIALNCLVSALLLLGLGALQRSRVAQAKARKTQYAA